MIPEIDRFSGSWIVTRKSDGQAIGEFFDRRSLERFNPDKVTIETALQYLARVNRHIKQEQTA